MKKTDRPTVTVYLDGACQLGSRAIQMCRRRFGADAVQRVVVTHCQAPALGTGLTRAAAVARLHLRRANSAMVSGARAFAEL